MTRSTLFAVSFGFAALMLAVFGALAPPALADTVDDEIIVDDSSSFSPFYRPSTAMESYMRGLADFFRAGGEFQLMNSIASKNYVEAYRRELDVRYQATKAYFDRRRLNAELRQREAGPPPTSEQLARIAQISAPAEMTPDHLDRASGAIFWPRMLREEPFRLQRQVIEQLFAERAARGGRLRAEDYAVFNQSVEQMRALLKAQVAAVPPNVYLEAREFLDRLAREGNS